MELPELLRKHGIDPEEFLRRTRAYRAYMLDIYPDADRDIPIRTMHKDIKLSYVDLSLHWEPQPEGYEFWAEINTEWEGADSRARWPALEGAIGALGPLEAELLEVEDGVT